MSGPCSMCQHFSMPASLDAKLRAGGWGVCGQGSAIAGYYQSQAEACQLEPTRFMAQEVPRETKPAAREAQPPPCDLPEELDFGS